MDFTTIPAGCATIGDVTPLGTIEAVSYTAYLIDGQWVPYHKIHGRPQRAVALAVPQEWVDSLSDEYVRRSQAESEANIRALFA